MPKVITFRRIIDNEEKSLARVSMNSCDRHSVGFGSELEMLKNEFIFVSQNKNPQFVIYMKMRI